jgi:hypothetical protein
MAQQASNFAFQFATPKVFGAGALIFSRGMCPEKNSENFRILQSHNKLSARHLHNWQLFAVDNCQTAALRLAIFQDFSLAAVLGIHRVCKTR